MTEVFTDECKGFPDTGGIKGIWFFKGTLARKNFQKHIENGDTKKIEAQIKRGSVMFLDATKPVIKQTL